MEQRAKSKKTATETFKMLKTEYGEECIYRTSVFASIKGSKKGEGRYKTMSGKAVLQLPEQKNRK
jgi:hypothetical protein